MGTSESTCGHSPKAIPGEGSGNCSPKKVKSVGRPVRRRLTSVSWRKAPSAPLFAVVRHAERADDIGASFGGVPWGLTEDAKLWPLDPPLSDDGTRLARDVGRELKEVADETGTTFQVVVSSPFFRCVQTAIEICHHIGPMCRLLIDNSLGEVLSPEIFGDQEPSSMLRPPSQVVEQCKANFVSGRRLHKPLGKKPVWPEDAASGRLRVLGSLENYVQRSLASKKNFILVTHAEGVAAAFESIQANRTVESVEYGAFFCACHRQEDEKQKQSKQKHAWKTQAHGLNFHAVSPEFLAVDDLVERPKKPLCATGQNVTPKSVASSTTNFFCLSDVDALSSPTSSPTHKRLASLVGACASSDSQEGSNALPVLLGRGMDESSSKFARKPKELCLENSALHRKRRVSSMSQGSYQSESSVFSEASSCQMLQEPYASEASLNSAVDESVCNI